MPRRKQNARGASGGGSIRKKIVKRNGKEYLYWEARYTSGYDPKTGKQIQHSITGKTQKEVAQKLRQVTTEIDQGAYHEPSQLTLAQWLDIWLEDYCRYLSYRTRTSYSSVIRNHLKPELGDIQLDRLPPHTIQRFCNSRLDAGLAPSTVRVIYLVLHCALEQAVRINYLRTNPANQCVLPQNTRRELTPLDDDGLKRFIEAVRGHPYELPFLVDVFTGMRQGELLGLTWDCVDFEAGCITVNKQLQNVEVAPGRKAYVLKELKNKRPRRITPAGEVMTWLRQQKKRQLEWHLRAGPAWENKEDLVFTNELGRYLSPGSMYQVFKKLVRQIGMPEARFHDLRHSYAVAALRSGDDVKTVQHNLGHSSAAFTLDVYGHVTEQMRRDSGQRMENYIKSLSG